MNVYLGIKKIILQILIYALSVCFVAFVGSIFQPVNDRAIFIAYAIVVPLFNLLPLAVFIILIHGIIIKKIDSIDKVDYIKWSTLIMSCLIMLVLLLLAEMGLLGLHPIANKLEGSKNEKAWESWVFYIIEGLIFVVFDFYLRMKKNNSVINL